MDWLTDSNSKHREGTVWQRRFWEYSIRDERDFQAHLRYIHLNPAKHGLVERVADWPFSTFLRHVQAGVYPMVWSAPPEPSAGRE